MLAYAYNEDGFSRVVVQDFVTRRALPQPRDLPRGVLTALDFSPDGRRLAIGITNATSAGDVWTFDLAGRGGVERWTQSELGDLDPSPLAEPELIRFSSFDGLSVPAFVYRPRNVAANARTPVIIDIHGGPESQTRPGWNPGAQYFADVLGATVILPNVRGSRRLRHALPQPRQCRAARGQRPRHRRVARLDRPQPNLDPRRVAVYGQSYGGYMSLAVMTHYSDRLVGGVERYGIANWISFLQNTEAYRRDNRRAEYGDEREPAMRAVFERISPLNNVRRITRPMLVMQGANDPRVPQSESDQVVRELRANGVETWYVLFADEGHGFLKKPNNDLGARWRRCSCGGCSGLSSARWENRADVAAGENSLPAGSRRSCARSAASVRLRSPLPATRSRRCRTRAAVPWSRRTDRRRRARRAARAELYRSRRRHQPHDRAESILGAQLVVNLHMPVDVLIDLRIGHRAHQASVT